MSSRAQRGFTLLEVVVAVFVFATVMGGILTLVQGNLARLHLARQALEASRAAEERMRELESAAETGEFPPTGRETGVFEEPFENFGWRLDVEPYALPLPPGTPESQKGKPSERSRLFRRPGVVGRADSEPVLRRIELRVHPVESDPNAADPFVLLLVGPEVPEGLTP